MCTISIVNAKFNWSWSQCVINSLLREDRENNNIEGNNLVGEKTPDAWWTWRMEEIMGSLKSMIGGCHWYGRWETRGALWWKWLWGTYTKIGIQGCEVM